ncbi:response regulator [Marinifilum fragile]|uniref:response regulator n=1 Tax=Marinifilum fragile TaxID=570161 RepID=UPI0006D1139B|nr:response regulator [Marinifilum fragile]
MFELKFGYKDKEADMFKNEDVEIPRQLSILIAEDNPINQKVAVLTLRHMGLHCDVAKNGLEAFEMQKENNYQVILMDMQMPVLDGLNATQKIRNFESDHPEMDKAFIIALTANAFVEDKKTCLEAGMNDFISKPLKEEALRKILSQITKSIA